MEINFGIFMIVENNFTLLSNHNVYLLTFIIIISLRVILTIIFN